MFLNELFLSNEEFFDKLIKKFSNLSSDYQSIIYGLFSIWIIFSIFYILKISIQRDPEKVNYYLYESIPNVFTTIGVLGTFIGIFFGLQTFDVNNINESIPILLEGLKTAFSTSILGIIFSLLFAKISHLILFQIEKKAKKNIKNLTNKSNITMEDKLNELTNIVNIILTTIAQEQRETKHTIIEQKNLFIDWITTKKSQYKQFNEMLNTNLTTIAQHQKQTQQTITEQVSDKLQILSQEQQNIEKVIIEQTEALKEIELKQIERSDLFQQQLQHKFDEFSQLLAKNNTEALVEVMKNVTKEFNKQMTTLISRLVQENFQELNNSVERLNSWQQENKQMVTTLTEQFKQVSNNIQQSSQALKQITEHTTKLISDGGYLNQLIKELRKVIIDDNKFEQISTKLADTASILEKNTQSFDATTNKLNNWVKNQMNFSDSVEKLLSRLEEIERIKDINEIFWENTKKQMNEGVNILSTSSQALAKDLDNLNQLYQEQLNDILNNLDLLIQRIIQKHEG